MRGEQFSAALTALPEEMVAEAMEPAHRSRSFSWLRLAVCAVLVLGLFFGFWPMQPEIVTAPGLLTVTVYAMDDSGSSAVISEPSSGLVDFPWEDWKWGPGVNAAPGLPILLSIEGKENVDFKVTVNGGSVMREKSGVAVYGTAFVQETETFQTENHCKLYWNCWEPGYSEMFTGHTAYLDVIVYENDYIIGFAVIGISRENDDQTETSWSFSLELLSSSFFPLIHGYHQKIEENTVRAMIEEVK